MDIPRKVRAKPGAWDPSICLVWGTRVFDFLRDHTTRHNDDGRGVWRVTFTPGVGLAIYRLDDDGVEDVIGGENRVGFLPQWYWERLHPAKIYAGDLKTLDLKRDASTAVETVDSLPEEKLMKPEEPFRVSADEVQGWQI